MYVLTNMTHFNHPFLKLIVDTNKQRRRSGPTLSGEEARIHISIHGSMLWLCCCRSF